MIGQRPTVIIIDEIAAHLRQLVSSGSEDVRRQAGAMPVFLKALFEYAAANSNVMVIVTLATRSDAYGQETSDIEELLGEAEGAFQDTMVGHKVHSRPHRNQSFVQRRTQRSRQILKTRLFERIDSESRCCRGRSYQIVLRRPRFQGRHATRRCRPTTRIR